MRAIHSLGIMTGTSCDGADAAMLRFTRTGGRWDEQLVRIASSDFPAGLRRALRAAQNGKLDIPTTASLTRDYSRWLGRFCGHALSKWRIARDSVVIAVHGQTVWHAPEQAISVQLLDASVVAALTGCTVVAAFRQPDLARGGEGAPLVALYHWLRANSTHFARALPFAIHNVGGIANLTYITRRREDVIAFDTGPGNALIDLAAERATHGKQCFDKDGKLALSALRKIDWKRIDSLGNHPFFKKRPPKSTGRELFNEAFLRKVPGQGAALVANATALTAHTMARAYVDFVLDGGRELNGVFVAGGGARNPALVRLFSRELARLTGEELPACVLPDRFAPAQSLEAMAFARLGFEGLQGNPVSLAAVTGASEDARGAGIFPGDNFKKLLHICL